ncbi:putative glycosyltransferase [Anaerohalosphaera lusitana]|uniref:Putative glycosyltransferase n=1 Tax=Anaerohalosphaera lusitana TaxID=1936003 RepID=A0A1U9NH50_9BACT|nr:PilZ domain-containing protein [Anaerohalosphaera lusitana]AQT67262.1 putative glycosyltransferase [Anaerohalosphaera lusitana]
MNSSEILTSDELMDVLAQAAEDQREATMSYLSGGKWHVLEVRLCFCSSEVLHVEAAERSNSVAYIQIDQPVGISFEKDFCKYVFETSVAGYQTGINSGLAGRAILLRPDRVEKLQRRAYYRAQVPADMRVKALFWHRGYTNNDVEIPAENYWEGHMLDLSAGGTLIEVDERLRDNFKEGQLVGVQFTPKPYAKPFLLEGLLRHIGEEWNGQVRLGVEFLGLEASAEGRETLRRLVEVVEEYREAENAQECGPVVAGDETAV